MPKDVFQGSTVSRRRSKAMRSLADSFAAGLDRLDLPRPLPTPVLLEELIRLAADRRGRPVILRKEIFPPHTASGLWMELATHDVIAVDRRAADWHQVLIVGHEIWHMLEDDCGAHDGDQAMAARLFADDSELEPAIAKLATRTNFREQAERDAEKFGLQLVTSLNPWLAQTANEAPASDIAKRIGASLGLPAR
ncbi:toxin-antitoxin system, toxin component [Streptomyces sp. NPDC086182]|uniref:toxin-antitoxin system, toxin component n=1 Tax=Streptomyces sp. NPDC086182 TaxID=3155058 RepID=UPI00342D02C4